MQEYFSWVASTLQDHLRGEEIYLCNFTAEESDFIRFNRSAVRQAGNVVQRFLAIDLIEGRRHAAGTLALAGDPATDLPRLTDLVTTLRETRACVPEDPYLLYATEARSTERHRQHQLPDRDAVVDEVRTVGKDRDLVGIYAAGATHAGFASSFGQRNWYTSHSYNLDWSFFHSADRAVKAAYAGFAWRGEEFSRIVDRAAAELDVVGRATRTIDRGRYRVYLTPAALYEVISLLGWGGFGLRAHRSKTTPLLRMIEQGAILHPSVTIVENTRDGFAPDFQEAGFLRPDTVPLVEKGIYRDCLVSPRSSLEYGVPTNGASPGEAPSSVDVAAGELSASRILRELGTGVYVGNLWYLNFSDRGACRTTGMTRFATFWVEGGEIQAPLNVMRFDETLYRMLGENLIALTDERETILDSGTYGRRSTDSARLPGALIEDFTFTL
jgi:predicted Zn-dependent protease